jgi:hypothetical protein
LSPPPWPSPGLHHPLAISPGFHFASKQQSTKNFSECKLSCITGLSETLQGFILNPGNIHVGGERSSVGSRPSHMQSWAHIPSAWSPGYLPFCSQPTSSGKHCLLFAQPESLRHGHETSAGTGLCPSHPSIRGAQSRAFRQWLVYVLQTVGKMYCDSPQGCGDGSGALAS